MTGVQWGWRIRCEHLGCERTHEEWGQHDARWNSGPPSLGVPKDWVHTRTKDSESGMVGYRFLCPDHSGEVLRWETGRYTWEKERQAVALTWWDRLVAVVTGKGVHARMGEVMREWEREHPRPTSPWGE